MRCCLRRHQDVSGCPGSVQESWLCIARASAGPGRRCAAGPGANGSWRGLRRHRCPCCQGECLPHHELSAELQSIREAVRSGQLEIQGGIYDLETGNVEFLGKSPQQAQLLESSVPLPPSMSSGAAADHGTHGVRTGADIAVKPEVALKLLQQGNERFAAGAPTAAITSKDMRQALVKCGQAPHSAILGCADSRVPVDTVFDAMPGDLFVLRNAGNTCTHATRWSRSRHHMTSLLVMM